jgi:hypothetical protein
MQRRFLIAGLLLLSSALLSPISISAQSILDQARADVKALTSPQFGGRGYDDNGDSLAAAFLRRRFAEIGLVPVLDGYEQTFTLPFDTFLATPTLTVNGRSLEPGIDFLPYASSPSGDTLRAVVTSVGYGLALGEDPTLDPAGAILLIQDRVPDSIRTRPGVNAAALSRAARLISAAERGARAVIFATDDPLSHGWTPDNAPIPAFIVRREMLPARIDSVSYTVVSERDKPFTTSNVIGMHTGTDLARKYLVVTGHYDHLGRLGPGVYFPGANDNASGIALMLALAKHFQNQPLRHSLVFIAFSGEEQGLLGSRHFVAEPAFPLRDIQFLVNLDMVASGEDGLVAVGGSDFAPEFELLSAINDSLQLGRLGHRKNAPNSDHYFFLNNGVRGFFLYTNRGTQPYHNPRDVPETLEWDDFMKTFQLVKTFLVEMDGR